MNIQCIIQIIFIFQQNVCSNFGKYLVKIHVTEEFIFITFRIYNSDIITGILYIKSRFFVHDKTSFIPICKILVKNFVSKEFIVLFIQ